uniref:Thyrotropin-releasing hormone receptor n=1 Tax=Parascaris univalens TaxID=6257 RepID=A0A915AHZ0_PARUN
MKEQAKMSASADSFTSQLCDQLGNSRRISNCSKETYPQFVQSSSLSQNTNSMRNFTLNCSKSSFKGKNQVVKILALVVAIFAICWLPYRVMVMYNSFAQQKWDPDWYIFLSKTMIFFNCAINPILYNVMSARFRNAFRSLLSGKKKIIYQIQHRRNRSSRPTSFRSPLADSKMLLDHTTTGCDRTLTPVSDRLHNAFSLRAL